MNLLWLVVFVFVVLVIFGGVAGSHWIFLLLLLLLLLFLF